MCVAIVENETRAQHSLYTISQLKIEHVKTEVKIRVTQELPTFLALQDRVLESIFLLCLPREALYVRIEAILATACFATHSTRALKVL